MKKTAPISFFILLVACVIFICGCGNKSIQKPDDDYEIKESPAILHYSDFTPDFEIRFVGNDDFGYYSIPATYVKYEEKKCR